LNSTIDFTFIVHSPDVRSATHDMMFSSSMSVEDFFKWLRSKGVNDKDCKTLSGKCKVLTSLS
jgi:hypothetical protein